jgi:hypothetical protein
MSLEQVTALPIERTAIVALFRARPDDIFVVKVNYWLNP